MKRECAWCKKTLGLDAEGPDADVRFPVTHGICDDCAADLIKAAEARADVEARRRILQKIPEPLVAFSNRLEVVETTAQAAQLFGGDYESFPGRRPGDVIGCVNARDGACGTGPECPSCRLRNVVTETARDGVPASHATSAKAILLDGKVTDVVLEFSSERVGSLSLLAIHRIGRIPPERVD